LQTGSAALAHAAGAATLWSKTRLSGNLARLRQQQVIEAIWKAIYDKICGTEWAQAENVYKASPASNHALGILKQRVHALPGLSAILARDYEKAASTPQVRTAWFCDITQRYGICDDQELCEFALRAVSQPQNIIATYGDGVAGSFERLSGNPTVLRAARLVALLAAIKAPVAPGSFLPRWLW